MRNVLVLGALLAFMPVAHAADKGGEFTHDAEYRIRYQHDEAWNTADKDADTNRNTMMQRFKLATTFKSGEKFAAHLSLLANSVLGDQTGNSANEVPDNAADLEVNQAYGTWMINDSWMAKFGRGGFTLADGSVISQNDWQATPYAFEGVLVNWEHEMMRLSLFMVKAEENLTPSNGNDDPESNFYGLALDWKSLPEFLKMANIHVMQVNADERDVGAGATYRKNEMRYGVVVGGDAANVDYKLQYAAHDGEEDGTAIGGTKRDKKGNMMGAEVGYSMPEMMKMHFGVAYHQDTGDDAGTSNDKYDSFYTEKHNSAGMMDVLGWGNLTFWKAAFTMSPMDQTEVGLQYWMFNRTENSSGATMGNNGYAGYAAGTDTSDDLGTEFDLHATHKYDGGFQITAWVGMFMPGKHIKNVAGGKDDTFNQLFVEGKMTF